MPDKIQEEVKRRIAELKANSQLIDVKKRMNMEMSVEKLKDSSDFFATIADNNSKYVIDRLLEAVAQAKTLELAEVIRRYFK